MSRRTASERCPGGGRPARAGLSAGRCVRSAGFALVLAAAVSPASAQVLFARKISSTQGGLSGVLSDGDRFGSSVAMIGDLDGDGIRDLAVGARGDGDGGFLRGAVWILFLRADGTVKASTKISSTQGGFAGPLTDLAFFGSSVAALGDLDGDGVGDLAVGAPGLSVFHPSGELWVLFLRSDGSVKSQRKIGAASGGFTGALGPDDRFASAVAVLGDVDGDGLVDVAVGAPGDEGGPGGKRGAVWILFLNADGTVRTHLKIGDSLGGFTGVLADFDAFGSSLAVLDDLDRDGIVEVVIGAPSSPLGSSGAAWTLFPAAGGTVRDQRRIGQGEGGFAGAAAGFELFGRAVSSLGDLDGDGVGDLAVGSQVDHLWLLLLRVDGTVRSHREIHDPAAGFVGGFGSSITSVEDWNGDGVIDVAVGAPEDADGGPERGAVWLLLLAGGDCNGNGTPDGQDIAVGSSQDCNANGIPDECELASGAQRDCNANGALDACDVLLGVSQDCNGNGVPDECDLAAFTSTDCNHNGVPDDCDIATGTSTDCNLDGVPDGCEPDCDGNGVPDDCDGPGGGIAIFGIGTLGSLGIPGLCAQTVPLVGAPFTLVAGNLPPVTPLFVALSARSGPPLDLTNGLVLNLGLPILLLAPLVTDAAGAAGLTLQITPGLAGRTLFFQVIAADGIGGSLYASSKGLEVAVP